VEVRVSGCVSSHQTITSLLAKINTNHAKNETYCQNQIVRASNSAPTFDNLALHSLTIFILTTNNAQDYYIMPIPTLLPASSNDQESVSTVTSPSFSDDRSTTDSSVSSVDSENGKIGVVDIDDSRLKSGGIFRSFRNLIASIPAKAAKSDLIVLMDIDYTMVHYNFFSTQEKAQAFIEKLPRGKCGMTVMYVQYKDNYHGFVVCTLRPGLMKFLKALASQCEVHIFTAGIRGHANRTAEMLDPDGTIFSKSGIWSANDGPYVHIEPSAHWKDISKLPLGRLGDLSRVVLIDDNASTMIANPGNVYHIPEFSNNNDDDELGKAWEFLSKKLIKGGDVRPILQKKFGVTSGLFRMENEGLCHKIDNFKAPRWESNAQNKWVFGAPPTPVEKNSIVVAMPMNPLRALTAKFVNKAGG
jgi:NLI interacting factor-like phosphatase